VNSAHTKQYWQGVNSALRDVCLLGDALRTRFKASKVDRGNLIADALASYEVEATGEAKVSAAAREALIFFFTHTPQTRRLFFFWRMPALKQVAG
jgi:2-polyprenyl-6-methoxyphenol hydroxylase-like FAD-dependent oxidoreductase